MADVLVAAIVAATTAGAFIMLPTHIPRRPRMGGPTAGWSEVKVSDSAIHTARLCMSRPSSRWLILVLVFASSLWLVGPYLLGLPPPHHPHGHDHLFDGPPPEGEGHGRRPPGGWFGRPSTKQPPEPHKGPETVWSTRAEQVKEAYRHAWKGYMKLASPADELLPVTGGGVNKYVFLPSLIIVIEQWAVSMDGE